MDALLPIPNEFSRNERIEDQGKPKTLGSGFVTSVLGEGGAAIVYEIWNPKLEIHRAVKLWRPNLSEKDLQRFETEIKITSKLDHPNIVEIHTVGEWNGLPYIEMERIDGLSLQQILRTNGALPPAVALAIMIMICRALIYAHQEEFNLYGRKRKGVIHCDIKPANIMITRGGVVKLMDFGIANPTNVSLHNDPDKVTGSLQYMAPEQIRSQQVDARTDIYAIGVVLYEILSGTKAFPSRQLLEVIEKRKTNDHVPLGQFCVNLPKRIYRLVADCMELRPENRYQNVSDLSKALVAVYRKLTPEDPQDIIRRYIESGTVPPHSFRISRQTALRILAGAVPAALLIVIFTIVFNPRRHDAPARAAAVSAQQVTPAAAVVPAVPPQQPEAAAALNEETVPATAVSPSAAESLSTPLPAKPVPPPASSAKRAAARKKTPGAVVATDPLSALEALVDGGNLSAAIRHFQKKTINDGLYYSLYARCLYESGEWKRACEMAETATRVRSARITEKARAGQLLLYRARYLSARFDAEANRETARTAIDAWWKVREHFDGTSESAKATFAESEIGRLSKILND